MATRSIFYPDDRRHDGMEYFGEGIPHHLVDGSSEVDSGESGRDVDAFLADNGHQRSDLKSFVMHTGGPKVLDASAAALGLHNGELDASWDLLEQGGEFVFGVGAMRAGGCDEEPASRAGDAGVAGGDGAGILLRAAAAAMVRAG